VHDIREGQGDRNVVAPKEEGLADGLVADKCTLYVVSKSSQPPLTDCSSAYDPIIDRTLVLEKPTFFH
jgi:hypothetical protein